MGIIYNVAAKGLMALTKTLIKHNTLTIKTSSTRLIKCISCADIKAQAEIIADAVENRVILVGALSSYTGKCEVERIINE